MTIQPISAYSAVLYLTPADLRERDICPRRLTAERALELLRESFAHAGLPLEGSLEIDTFSHQGGLLVFIRTCPPEQTVWSFADCESLLGAACALGDSLQEGALYWWEDCCWLVLPCREEGPLARLSEFGEEHGDPYILARLEEYGVPLLAGSAPAVLRRHFG